MFERILLPFVCLLCAFPFCMLPKIGKDSPKPISFWNGDEKRLAEIVKDVPAYNHEMARLYQRFAWCFLADGVLCAVFPFVGFLAMCLIFTVGIWVLWKQYKTILAKYS